MSKTQSQELEAASSPLRTTAAPAATAAAARQEGSANTALRAAALASTLLKREKCYNCYRELEFVSTAVKVKCPECQWLNKRTVSTVSVIGTAVIDADAEDAAVNSTSRADADGDASGKDKESKWHLLLKRRTAVARRLTPVQKSFVLLQLMFLLYTASATKSWLLKVLIRVSAALAGTDGRALKSMGKLLLVIIPVVVTLLSWLWVAAKPKQKQSWLAEWWLPSEPAWAGLGSYAYEMGFCVVHYMVLAAVYSWMWGNLVGKLKDNAAKLVMAVVVPYVLLPKVVPGLVWLGLKEVMF